MELKHQFRVPVPVDEAWAVLTDAERLAPHLPGAQLTDSDGDTHEGLVRVKVGPVTAAYRGKAVLDATDPQQREIGVDASGKDSKGQGTARAEMQLHLTPEGDETEVAVDIALRLTGKVAQFGRGVLEDVSTKLLEEFVTSLEADLQGDGSSAEASDTSDSEADSDGDADRDSRNDREQDDATVTPLRRAESEDTLPPPEPDPIDLLEVAGSSNQIKMIGGIVGLVALILVYLLRRRGR